MVLKNILISLIHLQKKKMKKITNCCSLQALIVIEQADKQDAF